MLATLTSSDAIAGDVRIGSLNRHGMRIAAVYIQPVTMEPGPAGGMKPADIHLEADIHALTGNPQGFREGDWMPYLRISYVIRKHGSSWSRTGSLMPMAAADGPHYAENIKLNGVGRYHLTYRIEPPELRTFHRHTDKETGTASWWKPFDVSWDFIYVGVGKKGGY